MILVRDFSYNPSTMLNDIRDNDNHDNIIPMKLKKIIATLKGNKKREHAIAHSLAGFH